MNTQRLGILTMTNENEEFMNAINESGKKIIFIGGGRQVGRTELIKRLIELGGNDNEKHTENEK